MTETIEFDGREAARPIRQDRAIKPFLADSDDARTGTVKLKSNTPERVIERVVGEAAETREKEAEKFGSVPLSESEKERIDFQETDIPTARAAKGVATGVGVGDWVSHFDETLTASENRQTIKDAKTDGGGRRDDGRETGQNAKRLAKANKRRKRESGGRLRDYGLLQQDDAAQEELRGRGSIGDVFDVGFNRDGQRLRGKGDDFDRLQDVHDERSKRARRVDERRQAKVTRDPIQWVNNPSQYDFPGIDTVQPNELHEQRSERAQRADERNIAPKAETKEQWATSPDRYDWPGVDRPNDYGPFGRDPIPPSEQGRGMGRPGALAPSDFENQPGGLFDKTLGSIPSSNRLSEDERQGLASGDDAESVFAQAEESRSGGAGLFDTSDSSQASLGGEQIETEEQATFSLDTDVRDAQGQESRRDVAQASEFGIDDRALDDSESDSGDQSGLEVFGGGTRDNQSLF